jgi:hypothetical protein
MAPNDQPGQTVIRASGPQDVALLLELFRELAAYERLEHEMRANEERLSGALFGERPAAVIGARTMGEWITHRLDGEALARVAGEPAGRSPEKRR